MDIRSFFRSASGAAPVKKTVVAAVSPAKKKSTGILSSSIKLDESTVFTYRVNLVCNRGTLRMLGSCSVVVGSITTLLLQAIRQIFLYLLLHHPFLSQILSLLLQELRPRKRSQ